MSESTIEVTADEAALLAAALIFTIHRRSEDELRVAHALEVVGLQGVTEMLRKISNFIQEENEKLLAKKEAEEQNAERR